jgi:hypothetical protein
MPKSHHVKNSTEQEIKPGQPQARYNIVHANLVVSFQDTQAERKTAG